MSDTRRILIVDSADCDMRATTWLLCEAGYSVALALTRSVAERRANDLDTMIIEPGLDADALQLAGDLLASGKTKRVLFYTESDRADVLREAQRLGPVVLKGDGPEALVAALRTAAQPMSGFPGAIDTASRAGSA